MSAVDIMNSKKSLVFESLTYKIERAMKNQCGMSVGFHLKPLCGYGSDLLYAKHQ